jgi:putative restriction endonuclease
MGQPDFTRDELVILLHHYAGEKQGLAPSVAELSSTMRELDIHADRGDPDAFRNPEGLARAVRRFRAMDEGTADRRTPAYADVWAEFGDDYARLSAEVDRIVADARSVPADVAEEAARRAAMWEQLRAAGDPASLPAAVLRETRTYDGGRGIWADKGTTAGVGGADAVAVSVLHTGDHYPDDLSDSALLYHYPETKRPGRDTMEIEALKSAGTLGLPVFVILRNGSGRAVKQGWVTDWDDPSKLFLIEFGEGRPALVSEPEELVLYGRASGVRRTVTSRPNQQRFRLNVLKRYGPTCAVCNVEALELLTAAHVVAVEKDGSDDPRNGLVLCWNHHRAFDLGLLRISTEGRVVFDNGHSAGDLGVTKLSLDALAARPAREALAARFESPEG